MMRLALVVSALGVAVLAVAVASGAMTAVLHGWLFAAHFVTGLSLGAAVLLLIHAITGGDWGEALHPSLRAMAATMPLAVVAWAPLAVSAGDLFPWAGVPAEALPETVAKKLAYLDVGFLQARTVVVLALFLGIAWIAAGARQPTTGAAAAALGVFGIAVSALAIDWLLAFEPEFYSTAYPPLHAVGAVATTMAAATLALRAAGGSAERMRDCGMLCLGWAMVWLYLAFMQYLIIWSGDLPYEIHWYIVRFQGGWRLPLALAIVCHLGVVAAMASPRLKVHPDAVAWAAAALVVGQAADLWWRTAPAFQSTLSLSHLADLASLLALGGAWLAVAMLWLRRQGRRAHA